MTVCGTGRENESQIDLKRQSHRQRGRQRERKLYDLVRKHFIAVCLSMYVCVEERERIPFFPLPGLPEPAVEEVAASIAYADHRHHPHLLHCLLSGKPWPGEGLSLIPLN